MAISYSPYPNLPTAADLPSSDDTPVDNELQNLLPNLLGALLASIWADRWDWFWGVDMGIYYHPYKAAMIPDGFLSLGVERIKDPGLRLSYVFWEENNIVPTLSLEVVSETYNGEYSKKKRDNARMGVPYYVVYNPFGGKLRRSGQRRLTPNQHQKLEVYQLHGDHYRLLRGSPVWLPEIGLGIGYDQGTYQGIMREWLYWYNEAGQRYFAPEELLTQVRQRAEQELQRAEQESRRVEQLSAYLRSQGIDPDNLPVT